MGKCCSKAGAGVYDPRTGAMGLSQDPVNTILSPGGPGNRSSAVTPNRSRRLSYRASVVELFSIIPEPPSEQVISTELPLLSKYDDLVSQFDGLIIEIKKHLDAEDLVRAHRVAVQVQKSLQMHTLKSKNNKQEEEVWKMAEQLAEVVDIADLGHMCEMSAKFLQDLAAPTTATPGGNPAVASESVTWKFQKAENNIATWTKVDDSGGKSGIGTFRLEALFPCSLESAAAAMVAEPLKKKWVPYCRMVENVNTTEIGSHVMHFKVHLPWPLGDRESTTGFRVINSLEDGEFMMFLGSRRAELLRGHIPAPHSATSLDIEYWNMILQPVADGQTVVRLIANVDPHASKYPTAVVNKGLLGFFKVLMNHLRNEAILVENKSYPDIRKSAHFRKVESLVKEAKAKRASSSRKVRK